MMTTGNFNKAITLQKDMIDVFQCLYIPEGSFTQIWFPHAEFNLYHVLYVKTDKKPPITITSIDDYVYPCNLFLVLLISYFGTTKFYMTL